ncbi:MAG TPA: MarR family transcriptional regulator [Ramlibacter sp.]|nr:MarR family transcriptional regulator [Ramlibacter sp.]
MSRFRYAVRRFLRFSEDVSRDAGITVLQYQVLLHTQGFAGRDWASVGELAERLQGHAHGVVALVSRCEEAGLVRRRQNDEDRRLVEVHLTAKGRRILEALGQLHRTQFDSLAALIEEARTDRAVD